MKSVINCCQANDRKWRVEKMKYLLMLASFFVAELGYADSSSIVEVAGYSCMGSEFSRKETERMALQDAKRKAVERSTTHIESVTEMEDFALKRDWVEAFASADVKVLAILSSVWDEPGDGDCFTVTIRAEVVPADQIVSRIRESSEDDPRSPLNIKVWASADKLKAGDTLKIYLQGNKAFFGRIIYTDAEGEVLQLLPNAHRADDYFQGGARYEVPSALDPIVLRIKEPFGRETVTVYASTAPLGDLETQQLGAFFRVSTAPSDVARKNRVRSASGSENSNDTRKAGVSEFAETTVTVLTEP
jgi:hypothetical protein